MLTFICARVIAVITEMADGRIDVIASRALRRLDGSHDVAARPSWARRDPGRRWKLAVGPLMYTPSSPAALPYEVLMPDAKKARAVGVNHIALEVGDIDEALSFYGRIFAFELRGKSEDMAFIDLGDQFLALQKGRRQSPDDGRHFGLVVDDKEAVRQALAEAGVEVLPGPFLDFRDPWGNRVEIVGYDNIQFSRRRTFCAAWG
jgi:lactoylglutathione lyase